MNWDWFYFLYSISFMFLVFGFIWKVVYTIFGLATMVLNESVRIFVLKLSMLLPFYFFATYTLFAALYVNDGEKSVLLITIGGFFMLMHGLMGISQTKSEMDKNGEYDHDGIIKARYIGLIFGIGLYIYLIFDKSPANNVVIFKVAEVIDWFRTVPVLNWFVAAASFLYVIYSLLIGLAAFFSIIVLILSSIREKQTTST